MFTINDRSLISEQATGSNGTFNNNKRFNIFLRPLKTSLSIKTIHYGFAKPQKIV